MYVCMYVYVCIHMYTYCGMICRIQSKSMALVEDRAKGRMPAVRSVGASKGHGCSLVGRVDALDDGFCCEPIRISME